MGSVESGIDLEEIRKVFAETFPSAARIVLAHPDEDQTIAARNLYKGFKMGYQLGVAKAESTK